jgi:hypothetical protein
MVACLCPVLVYQTLTREESSGQPDSVPTRMSGSEIGQTMESIMPSLHLGKDPAAPDAVTIS